MCRSERVALLDVVLGFDLAFCTTIHKSQCSTIDEPYAVHDVAYMLQRLDAKAARALLYVACSRARRAARAHRDVSESKEMRNEKTKKRKKEKKKK